MFERSGEQQMLVSNVRDAVERDVEPILQNYGKEEPLSKADVLDVLSVFSEVGLLGRDIPEEVGGAALDHTTWARMFEQLPMQTDLVTMISSETARMIHTAGTDRVREEYLGPLLRGEIVGCAGISEPGVGSNPREIETIAEKDGDEWVINGTKTWISNGQIADVAVIVADTPKGKTHFLVDADTEGFDRQRLEMLGRRYDHMGQLYFDEVRVPEAHVVGSLGDALDRTYQSFELGRANVALLGVKTAQNALDAAIEYANDREQFGKPIGEHQLVQRLIAEGATYVDAARLLAYRALDHFDNGHRAATEGAMAKWFATESAVEVTSNAIQIHGAMGLSRELDVERYFRDAKMLTIPEGTTQINKLIIARDLLELSAFR
ncbi:acyl-CoA dehydrogenase family protein [Natrinema caseinilyticum]|uniref:acyl-CoA dehydrogenase family protein n=1 Tax=Natrinema caseinilyticum TaxID=2961570 RepID=UPI0020C4787E|nr:acyl-CoA dehydrogenase family protein [Natrinema caseinilyticum]